MKKFLYKHFNSRHLIAVEETNIHDVIDVVNNSIAPNKPEVSTIGTLWHVEVVCDLVQWTSIKKNLKQKDYYVRVYFYGKLTGVRSEKL